MDDLIVIIMTILIAGAGAIGQLKKKKQIPVAAEEPKNPENIWDLFREETLLPERNTGHEYFEMGQQESEPYENEQGYNFAATDEGGTLIKKEVKIQPVVKRTTQKNKEKFSLRKAVIYSEILNRKYT
ncbi:MAG: hypothetical protein FD181_1784 [Prolixibacteraceae bacterium]|nr:MAG: hypothetical protein FD181_1784 [Prolixibacteraceae bacterium]